MILHIIMSNPVSWIDLNLWNKDSKTKQDRVIDVSFNTLIQQKFKAHVSRCSIKLNWHRVDCANGIVPLNS